MTDERYNMKSNMNTITNNTSNPHPIALDAAIPPKKWYYRDLISSLRKLSSHNTTTNPNNNTQIPNSSSLSPHNSSPNPKINAINRYLNGGYLKEKNGKAQKTSTSRGFSRARIEEIEPNGNTKITEIESKMSPKEVREMIKDNCSLIKTVKDPEQLAGIERRLKRIYEQRKRGASTPETLARYLEHTCDLEPWQADRIIQDQMNKYDRKAALELMRKQGVKLVRWCAGECEHHRPSHITNWPRGLNGCVFGINEPPIDPATGKKIYPGDEINCHCYLEAVE